MEKTCVICENTVEEKEKLSLGKVIMHKDCWSNLSMWQQAEILKLHNAITRIRLS